MAKKVIKQLLNFSGLEVSRYRPSNHAWYSTLFEKYSSYTMVPEVEFKLNLDLCYQFRQVSGHYVECGVWRGGMSAAIAEVLGKERHFHLFDSFQGLPPARDIDGKEALAWQRDVTSPTYFDNCKAEKSFVIQAMTMAAHHHYHVYEGWFEQTLPTFPGGPIGILRIDADWYDSVITCLCNLFPLVVEGGIVILDDYYTWAGCSKAVHNYLSEIKSESRIYQWNNQIAFIRKK